jgi:hypothetical protein
MRKRIWIPETVVDVTAKTVEVNYAPALMMGVFHIYLIDARTQEVKQYLEFPNLLTDSGMDAIGNGTNQWALHVWCGVGTDSTTPAVTDTTLGSEILPRTTDDGEFDETIGFVTSSGWPSDKSGSYHFRRINRVFTEDEANGILTEVGFFNASTGGTMFLRALFKDSSGVPITITKTASDQLRIIHELRMYPPIDIVTGSMIIGATTHSWSGSGLDIDVTEGWGWNQTLQITNFNALGSWDWKAQACTSASGLIDPTGSIADFSPIGSSRIAHSTVENQSYVGGTFQRDAIISWSGSVANFRITGFTMSPTANLAAVYTHQFSIEPAISKSSADVLRLIFRQPFGRAVTT